MCLCVSVCVCVAFLVSFYLTAYAQKVSMQCDLLVPSSVYHRSEVVAYSAHNILNHFTGVNFLST